MYFGVAVPVLPSQWHLPAYIVLGIFVFVHIVSYLISTSIDPVDPYSGQKGTDKRGVFDRTQHAHVIENHYCYICETEILPKSKHCSACNKCVSGFDHHCKWLNNCVGRKNYKFFLLVLVSGLATAILVLLVLLYIGIVYWVKPELLHPDLIESTTQPPLYTVNTTDILLTEPPGAIIDYQSGLRIFVVVPGWVFFTAIVLTIILMLVTVILMLHLLGFHIYLICHDMSTYDYIIMRREEEQRKDLDDAEMKRVTKTKWWKRNKVAPMDNTSESMELGVKRDMSTSLVPLKDRHILSNESFIVDETEHKLESQPNHLSEDPPPQRESSNEQQLPGVPKLSPSSPKQRKKKKKKKKTPRKLPPVRNLPPLFSHEDMESLDRSFGAAHSKGIDLSHSQPETFLEQHIVRRYSLPYSQIPAMSGSEQFAVTGPIKQSSSTNGLAGRMLPFIPVISETPLPLAESYHSSSAESLQEMPALSSSLPAGILRRGSTPAEMPSGRPRSRPIDV